MKLARIPAVVLCATLLLVVSDSLAGMSMQGMSMQGMSMQGMSMQGMSMQGMSMQGMSMQGMSMQGMSMQGMSMQGMSMQGMSMQGMSMQGMSMQGMSMQGMSMQGMSMQGMSMQGMPLRGIDRLRSLGASMTFDGISYAPAQVSGRSLQGLQSATPPIVYTATPQATIDGVHLQASPTDSGPGSYLYVPGLAGTSADIAGTFWNLGFHDAAGDPGSLIAYVAAVEKDRQFNTSTSPSNADIYLYSVYFRQPATGQWTALCPVDQNHPDGQAPAMAVPLDANDWTSAASRARIGFACTGSGVAAKCARNWGYKPWVSSPVDLGPYYRACLVAARADYCQDDQSFTRNGTTVDLFDMRPGLPSINPTVGFPYAPGSLAPMLHEEYQISIANRVGPGNTLFQSGLESSRYPDLDPGRSCAAASYIDRCDPTEPYTCYRENNLSAQPYGALLAVNSPRHCAHRDDVTGDPLDPMCNECTTRVCEVDPTCCGDPGDSYYPRALVWDQTCIGLRNQVCRSTPEATAPWPAGVAATPAGTAPVVVWRGAIGAFDGFVTAGSTTYAEGWACDPDFPQASSAIQVSVGGELGASGTTLVTSTADQSLPSAGWREIVAAECGPGAGRHGFRVALPSGSAGQDVYVYGLDSTVPAAPFSLLRGGKKTLPATGAAALDPAAAIWTGWIEPPVSGSVKFCKRQPGAPAACDAMSPVNPTSADRYRIWVNGAYVAGNWKDAAGTPGGFTADPPAPPQLSTTPGLYLQEGVRYPVRIEYQRVAPLVASSEMVLLWTLDNGATWAPVPTSALYAAGTPNGNGLRGSYFGGVTSIDALPATTPLNQTWGPLDNVWTSGPADPFKPTTPLPQGLTVKQDFGARFEGQVVPPVSGDYVFSAESDGVVRITVNGIVVGGAGGGPPGLEPDTCDHDICVAGEAISRTCKQGSFCSGVICLQDPTCCSITWDARCVEEVSRLCGLTCSPTPPVAITLNAGWRYDIEVEYVHTGEHDNQVVRAAKLKLDWALASGGPRDVVPVERLFASTDTAAGIGQGLNAATFSDAGFQTPALDHVERAVDFHGATPPVPVRSGELVCVSSGATGCASVEKLGAPVLGTATSTGLTGNGATRGATVTVTEGTVIGTAVIPSDGSAGGLFTIAASLARGLHTFTVTQSLGAATSDPISFTLEVRDPNAPPPPALAQPGEPIVSGNGTVTVGGTALAGATVTVTARPRESGAPVTATFLADSAGKWTASFTLPPGSYDVSATQTAGGATSSAGAPVNVQVSLPPLTVTSPVDGLSITNSAGASTVAVSIQGQGAGASLGAVLVADGDGDGTSNVTRLTPSNGAFSGIVKLDNGRHVLKLFQHAAGLDGAAVTRTVIVRPPLGSLAIDKLKSGMVETTIPAPPAVATTDAVVTVEGSGGLPATGLPGTVVVYQGTVVVGQGPLDDKGQFGVPVTLTGAGSQTLSVSQIARSLSGGGSAESASTSVSVLVRPAAPVITAPPTAFKQDALSLTVSGTAAPRSTVTLSWDGAALSQTATALADGTFTVQVTSGLTKGTHALTATATADTARSLPSAPPVLISLGDVTPPTVTVSSARTFTGDDSGAAVNLAGMVSATDGTVALPASAITCSPPATSAVHFALGATAVTCLAVDAAGNTGSTTFTITVKPSAAPSITASGLTAEAQGKDGAVVNYKVSATGYTADCAPPGSGQTQACTQWQPAYDGLQMGWAALVQNTAAGADHGTLYMAPQGLDPVDHTSSPRFLKLAGDKSAWQELPAATGPKRTVSIDQSLVIGSGSPAVLYAALDNRLDGPGIAISSDGGQSWLPALSGIGIAGIVADPKDPTRLHQFAYRGEAYYPRAQKPELFETHDGWATWSDAGQGLGNPVTAMAVDPTTDRQYASIVPLAGDPLPANLYVRENGGVWQAVPIPPLGSAMRAVISRIAVAPAVDGCGHPQTGPTVIANELIYRKGSDVEWTDGPGPLATSYAPAATFDHTNACVAYAASNGTFGKSLDGGRTFTTVGATVLSPDLLLQDVDAPSTFYMTDYFVGPVVTTDGGSTWAPLPPTPRATDLGFRGIGDLAVDPVDPKIVLASITGGMFKSTDGGIHWVPANTGVPTETAYFLARRLMIDPFQRNVVYAGYAGPPGDAFKSSWVTSPNAGGIWTSLVSAAGPAAGALGLDPVTAGHWLSVGPRPDGAGGTLLVLNDNAGMTGAAVSAVLAPGAGTLASPSGGSLGVRPYALQMIPDPARTVMMSWNRDAALGVPDVSFFPYQTARTATATLPLSGGGMGRSDAFVSDYDGLGRSNVFYDAGDGLPRAYVDGAAIGQTPNVLYRTTVDNLRRGPARAAAWEPLGGDDGHGPFVQLVIDPTSGGQSMYSAGFSNALWNRLWESHDGGHSWKQDTSAPPFVSRVWLSPADGALYAMVSPTAMSPGDALGNTLFPGSAFGLLWKRAPVSGVPVGARVALGDLRVSCHGPTAPPAQVDQNQLPLRPASPGSTFPLGATTITCAATDVFGNPGTASFVVNVVDSTPPVLTLDTPPGPATAPAGGTAAVTFAVSASDAIDGSRPVTCTPASGSAFAIGVTTVTCSASDARSPANAASLSFPVVVSQQGGPALAPPTLTVPTAPVEATGPGGAPLAVTAATAAGAALTPACTPAIGSVVKMGSTAVSCSATDPGNGLRAQTTFMLAVQDSTAPAVTTPASLSVAAQGGFGARVSFTAQASDVVDGALTPTCTPSSGAVFALGATQVVCRATDRAGNQGFGRFTVTVNDQSQAILHLADVTVDANDWSGAAVAYNPAPYATDISNNPVAITCAPPSGTHLPVGDTSVSCTAAAGTSHEADGHFVVHVVDQSAPVVTVPGPIVAEATGPGGASVTFAATARDLVSGAVAPVCRMTTGLGLPTPVVSGASFPIGDSLVTCSATDAAGNVGSAAFSVTVHDTTPPVLTLPGAVSASGDITDSATVTFAASAADAVSGAVSVACSPLSGTQFAVGTSTVSCLARDAAGNASQGTFTVTVNKGNLRINLINAKYNANTTLLGTPLTGSLQQFSDGAKQDFTGAGNNSSIYVGDAVNAAYIVLGFIRGDYLSQGAQSGVLGYPITDESNTTFATGRYNFFQFGRILWKNGATAAYSTHGNIDAYYTKVGLEWGKLGYPQSDEAAFGSGRKNDFELGKIYFKNGASRGVITSLTSGDKLATQSWARFTRASITAQGTGGCINVAGAGFPAGAQVSFRTNDPGTTGTHASRGTATVKSDGTFTFDESVVNTSQACTPGILRVNGLATIEASAGGSTAIIGVSTTAGSAYTGSL